MKLESNCGVEKAGKLMTGDASSLAARRVAEA